MKPVSFVGVDPASGDFESALVRTGLQRVSYKIFTIAGSGLDDLVCWIRNENIDVVAVEGSGGYAKPLENALRTANIPFYSFSPYRIAQYRQAVLGEHKNNQKDALSVALYARELAGQNDLDQYRRTWFYDETLRPLIRLYEQKQREATREINRLWQRIQNVSGDIFLLLRDLSDSTRRSRCLAQQWALKLFVYYPDLTTWQSFTRDGIAQVLNEHRIGIIDKVMMLKDMAAAVHPYSEVAQVELQVTASTALTLKKILRTLYHQLEVETTKNTTTQRLMEYRGIGVLTAATIVAEIADITRFPNNNHLASYAGLGRREYKTGSGNTERSKSFYNRRLKNAFITGARNYTLFNPDSHLTGYYRSLKSRGMRQTEMYKRVARALVRRFYRDMIVISELDNEETRDEGNPKPAPVENQSLKQPHTSLPANNYTPSKSKIIVSADNCKKSSKEVLIEISS